MDKITETEKVIAAVTPEQADKVIEGLKKDIGEEAALKAAAAFLSAGITKPKPAIMTTELWLMLATNAGTIASAAAGFIPAPYGVIVASVVGVITSTIYTIMRSKVKTAASEAAASPEVSNFVSVLKDLQDKKPVASA
jgi:hypothetical protein